MVLATGRLLIHDAMSHVPVLGVLKQLQPKCAHGQTVLLLNEPMRGRAALIGTPVF